MIKLESLHKYFNKGRQNEIHVINNVDLVLPEKGIVAIFGKSGCGKTTLLNVIGGLDKYHSGSVYVNGEDITQNTDVIRNRDMGYIFQNYNLNKEETCFDNVANALRLCGIKDETVLEDRVLTALKNVDMEKYAKRTPDTLSGGQQQRIAIARAIVKNPKIILADEPTGNLDEANTIMIMDLLKEISREHLVLLVTHEANLVDYYCDTVIELSDGKVINVRKNESTEGFSGKDKNAIYLGEFEKKCAQNDNIDVEYYGETPKEPIKLKIVNNNGKFYLKVETDGISILDASTELKLREGVYEQKKEGRAEHEKMQMSDLPTVEGTHFGTLFSLKSSIKSGYISFSKNKKRGKKLLRRCMILFAAVLVFMSAVFGTSISQLLDIKKSYNHNVFYVYASDGEISEKINSAIGDSDSAIDYARMEYSYPNGDENISFRTGAFETFSSNFYDINFSTNFVIMDVTAAEELSLVCGKKDNLSEAEMIITTAAADKLLEKSSLGYIEKYEDFLGLISSSFIVGGKYFRIVGVVESKESSAYISELCMARYVLDSSSLNVLASSYSDMEVPKGEAVFVVKYKNEKAELPDVNDIVKINGKDIKIKKVISDCDYETWLKNKNISKIDEETYVGEDAQEGLKHFEYLEYYYSELDEYLKEKLFFSSEDVILWLATEKGVDVAKHCYTSEEFYKATEYKKRYGKYPTFEELDKVYNSIPDSKIEVEKYVLKYSEEFHLSADKTYRYYDTAYILNDSDYIEISKKTGESHVTAKPENYQYNNYYFDDYYYEDIYGIEVDMLDFEMTPGYATDLPKEGFCYSLIHSKDPEKTEKWLNENFADLKAKGSFDPIITPDDILSKLLLRSEREIIRGLVAMLVILALLSVCMYFIMRSSLMSRIKEVGIYRAIGVSKKNLIFKFLVEAFVVSSLTMLLGYLFSSGFIAFCLWLSPAVENLLFYPLWMAGIVLAILYALSLFCGTIPIMMLLRKTPSQILSKYDI